MPFIVCRKNTPMSDAEFVIYVRLALQRGIALGYTPRALEPVSQAHWLPIWNDADTATAFANELGKRTQHNDWTILQTPGDNESGPLTPIVIQVSRRATEHFFRLHSLTQVILREACPQSKPIATSLTISNEQLQDYLTTQGSFDVFAAEVLPVLTGLKTEILNEFGYTLLDDTTQESLVAAAPKIPVAV